MNKQYVITRKIYDERHEPLSYEVLDETNLYTYGCVLLEILFNKDADRYKDRRFRIEHGVVKQNFKGNTERAYIRVFEERGDDVATIAVYSLQKTI